MIQMSVLLAAVLPLGERVYVPVDQNNYCPMCACACANGEVISFVHISTQKSEISRLIHKKACLFGF